MPGPAVLKQRGARDDLVPHSQRHVAPLGPAAVQIRTVHQIADADRGADPVIRQALEVVDQVLAGEVLLGHRAVPIVLVADVAVQVDLRRHDGLAGQVDVRGAGRHLNLATPADPRELCRSRRETPSSRSGGAVAGNQPRAFVHGGTAAASLTLDDRRARRQIRHAAMSTMHVVFSRPIDCLLTVGAGRNSKSKCKKQKAKCKKEFFGASTRSFLFAF